YNAVATNDNFANRFTVTGSGALTATGSNVGASVEIGEPTDGVSGNTPSVWWTWGAPCSFSFTSPSTFIDTHGSSFDTVLAIFTGSRHGSLTFFAADDENGEAVPGGHT